MKESQNIFLPGGFKQFRILKTKYVLNDKKVLIIGSGSEKIAEKMIESGASSATMIVNDYDSFYDLEKIKDTVVQVISFDTYLDKFVVSFTLKTSKFALTNENSTRENWGGVNIAYLF